MAGHSELPLRKESWNPALFLNISIRKNQNDPQELAASRPGYGRMPSLFLSNAVLFLPGKTVNSWTGEKSEIRIRISS